VKKLSATACVRIRNPDRGKKIYTQQLRELSRVDRVGLRPRLPDEFHLSSVSYAYDVPRAFELIVQPLPLESGFHPHRYRSWESAEEVT